MAVNEWCVRFSTILDKYCPHRGSGAMESMEHMFFSCLLAQQAWRYAPNIIWPLFAKGDNLGL